MLVKIVSLLLIILFGGTLLFLLLKSHTHLIEQMRPFKSCNKAPLYAQTTLKEESI